MSSRLTPFGKLVVFLQGKYLKANTDSLGLDSVVWSEFCYLVLGSSLPLHKHATELMVYRGLLSRREQGGWVLDLKALKEFKA